MTPTPIRHLVTALVLFAASGILSAGTAAAATVVVTSSAELEAALEASAPANPVASTLPGTETPCPTLGFDGAGAAAASVTTYTRCGFTVTAITPNWVVWTGSGHSAPLIAFISAAGETTTAEILVTADAGPFTFRSIDLYSSGTPIPYVITGSLNATRVFSLQSTEWHLFGNFATIVNPSPEAQIDRLVVRLSNLADSCCENSTGLDNIALK